MAMAEPSGAMVLGRISVLVWRSCGGQSPWFLRRVLEVGVNSRVTVGGVVGPWRGVAAPLLSCCFTWRFCRRAGIESAKVLCIATGSGSFRHSFLPVQIPHLIFHPRSHGCGWRFLICYVEGIGS